MPTTTREDDDELVHLEPVATTVAGASTLAATVGAGAVTSELLVSGLGPDVLRSARIADEQKVGGGVTESMVVWPSSLAAHVPSSHDSPNASPTCSLHDGAVNDPCTPRPLIRPWMYRHGHDSTLPIFKIFHSPPATSYAGRNAPSLLFSSTSWPSSLFARTLPSPSRKSSQRPVSARHKPVSSTVLGTARRAWARL